MKKEILSIVKGNCSKKEYTYNTSAKISEDVRMSRSEVAGILNELVNECKLIKIEEKPIFYLDRDWTNKEFKVDVQEKSYPNIDAIIESNVTLNDFEKMVGHEGSLSELVKQCKATIAYPPKGLPMMLYGPTGTGKSYIARLAYEYAKRKGLLKENGKFISVNCSEYANNPELLTANLFGHVKGAFTGADKENPGLMSLANGGVLFLDEVHNLRAECQEKLFQFMDQAIYHHVGDNEKWYESDVRLIFATTENPEEVLLKTLQRRIPMTIHIPSLIERGMQERVQLIYMMFKEEEKKLHKKIKISSKVYNVLLSYNFPGNIGGLKSCIQSCCVKSLFDVSEAGEMIIHLHSLPEEVIQTYTSKSQVYLDQNEYIMIDDLQDFIHTEKDVICLNEKLLREYVKFTMNELSVEGLIFKNKQILREYFDKVFYKKNEVGEKDLYHKGIQHIFDLISERYGLKVQNNDLIALSYYLNDYNKEYHSFTNWSSKNFELVNQYLMFMKNEFYHEYTIAKEVCKYLGSYLDVEMLAISELFFLMFIKDIEKEEGRKQIAIILAHGYSTASSIADASNQFLGNYVFDAIDMPLNVDTNTIIQKLNVFLSRVGKFDDLLLLVDMGSLEDIYKGINVENSNVGIINNVSTKTALEIGNGILQGSAMEDIFKKVVEYNNVVYHIEKNKHKEKVILCSCASGMGTAEKIRTIIQNSLPTNLSILVKTYNYNELIEKGTSDTFFDDYHVLFVIGTLNPNIDELNFIAIEDLIINDCLSKLDPYLEDYMSQEQLEYFRKNILKNFSLSNIMNSLTILNPTKLLEHVADAIDRLQKIMSKQLTHNTCFGLYVHISCMVERLVMQRQIDSYNDENTFKQENEMFVLQVKQAFKEVEEFYGVEIPVSEIGYIYDYVKNDNKR